MANTKKEWSNLRTIEKVGQIAVNVAAILVALITTLMLYAFPQKCDIDKQYLWCYTHPGSIGDIVGMILFWFGCFWLSGIWGYLVADDDADPWRTITIASWCCAAAGPAIIIIF